MWRLLVVIGLLVASCVPAVISESPVVYPELAAPFIVYGRASAQVDYKHVWDRTRECIGDGVEDVEIRYDDVHFFVADSMYHLTGIEALAVTDSRRNVTIFSKRAPGILELAGYQMDDLAQHEFIHQFTTQPHGSDVFYRCDPLYQAVL